MGDALVKDLVGGCGDYGDLGCREQAADHCEPIPAERRHVIIFTALKARPSG